MSATSLPVTGRRLHVATEYHGRDLDAAEAAAKAFLTALGIDLDKEALAETPARMAKAYAELLTPREFDLTTFDNDEGYEQLVLVQGIPFRSLCEHHALPFIGTADVGYCISQASGSLDCPSSRGWWSCSPTAPRCRSE